MKRNQPLSGASSKKKTKQTRPEISDFTDIGRGVSSGVFGGKLAVVKKNIGDEYIPLYDLWKSTKALPEVYEVWKDKETGWNTVMMEKLVPFVYKKELEPAYYAAIEEVYNLSKFKNMDISPSNTMMRADGQIVFIDLWTHGLTVAYFATRSEEYPLHGIIKSLGRVLFECKNKESITQKYKREVEELQSIITKKDRFALFTRSYSGFYDLDEKSGSNLYFLVHVGTALKRARLAKKFIEDLGKTMEDYEKTSLTESTIPEFDSYLDSVIWKTWKHIDEVVKELGANEQEMIMFNDN
jgi:hypothetical protein